MIGCLEAKQRHEIMPIRVIKAAIDRFLHASTIQDTLGAMYKVGVAQVCDTMRIFELYSSQMQEKLQKRVYL